MRTAIEPKNVLVVDDEEEMRIALKEALSRAGHKVFTAGNGEEGLKAFEEKSPEIIISDMRMPRMNGLDLLRAIRERKSEAPFVLITAYGAVDDAVEAMKEGASDYILKPFSADTLDELFRRLFNGADEARPVSLKKPGVEPSPAKKKFQGRVIVSVNDRLQQTLDIARRVAPSRSTVLVHGESGTGKELVARFIHENSDRSDGPFVAVNCAALPESLLESELFGHEKGSFTGAIARKTGKFELADGGTLLLDEVTEMDPQLQAKLLRVLQENEIDRVGGAHPVPINVRVIATTNRDIKQAVTEGKFREDLYFRLNVIPLYLPPLRERTGDIAALVGHFVEKFNALMGKALEGLDDEAMQALERHSWRGNVRELENVMERAVLLSSGPLIKVADLMLDIVKSPDVSAATPAAGDELAPGVTVAQMEKKLIMKTLESVQGNRTRAAESLGVSIRTLRNKLNEYRMDNGL
ncbi:MAG: sigma-54-dependent Fis family transcriptional regulator [Nitrospinae bacterium]|nr:sigma-54-dependent Fis family transcriptional regulator [Nitrospinota bacterium]